MSREPNRQAEDVAADPIRQLYFSIVCDQSIPNEGWAVSSSSERTDSLNRIVAAWPFGFCDDLYLHDRRKLDDQRDNHRMIWILRENGTHLYPVLCDSTGEARYYRQVIEYWSGEDKLNQASSDADPCSNLGMVAEALKARGEASADGRPAGSVSRRGLPAGGHNTTCPPGGQNIDCRWRQPPVHVGSHHSPEGDTWLLINNFFITLFSVPRNAASVAKRSVSRRRLGLCGGHRQESRWFRHPNWWLLRSRASTCPKSRENCRV
jgi:hypothetical protein